jgi:hypothetical protein
MRLFTSLLAVATFMVAGAATAALNVSSPQSAGLTVLPGDLVTIDIQVSTTLPEALALGLRAANYDPTILTNGTATVVPTAIFGFEAAPGVVIGGLNNSATAGEQAPAPGIRAGWSINLFQGVAVSPAFAAGPDSFQVTFIAGAPGVTTVDLGAFADYSDTYAGGDNGMNPASVTVTVIPELITTAELP